MKEDVKGQTAKQLTSTPDQCTQTTPCAENFHGKSSRAVAFRSFKVLVKRNVTLFFKDKAMFFVSLITPIILLVLYATFLWNVYEDSFLSSVAAFGAEIDMKLVRGCVGGELLSSLLAVSCVTVSFCANMLMVQDKVNGVDNDFKMTPIKSGTLAMSYYTATLLSTLIVSFAALGAGLIFIAIKGWYLTFADVLLIVVDVILLTSFGTALSSVIGYFLVSQGQISAVGTIVSSGYGFICGAYMPISQFPAWLQKGVMFLPGTYGTSLLRTHCMGGTFREMSALFPEHVPAIKKSVDCTLSFFGTDVGTFASYAVLICSVVALLAAYCLIVKLKNAKKHTKPKNAAIR